MPKEFNWQWDRMEEYRLEQAAPLDDGDEPEEPEDPGSKPEYKTREPKVIAEEFLGKDRSLTNLSYVEHALELRKAVIERGGRDPFLPNDPSYAITEFDTNAAEQTATTLQQVVDKAAGDPNVFRGLLETTLVETFRPKKQATR